MEYDDPGHSPKSSVLPNIEEVKDFEAIKSNFSCAICLSITTDPCMPPCGHLFCTQCLLQWVKSNPEPACPKCRTVFRLDSIVHITNGYSTKFKSSVNTKRKILKPGISPQNMIFGNLIIYHEETLKPSLRFIGLTALTFLLAMLAIDHILSSL